MYPRFVPVLYETELPPVLRDTPGPYRRSDYEALPDEPRCELLEGYLVVSPAPNRRHQELLGLLVDRLRSYARRSGGRAYFAPFDAPLSERSVVQPDLLFLGPRHLDRLGERLEGIPDLAVEILSPSSLRRDRTVKMELYARAGVPEYWIFDPAASNASFFRLEGSSYRALPAKERFVSPELPGFELDLNELWRELEALEPPAR